jgi:MFS superfamily sulfate permease-like transporter
MVRLFPSLRGYRAAWLSGDLLAGLMLAAIAVPEQLATAQLAGFPAITGLFAFAAGSVAYALLGRNPYMSVGGDSTIAPIFAGSLAALAATRGAHDPSIASFLAITVGLVLVIAALARAGWIANLLSVPVTIGFLAGIAVHIVVGQLPAILGVSASGNVLLEHIWTIGTQLAHTNVADLAIASAVLAIALVGARINHRIPAPLIGLLGAALVTHVFALDRHDVAMLAIVHAQLPSVRIPALPDVGDLAALTPITLIVAAVCIMQTSAVGRSFPATPGEGEDIGSDFLAVGVGSVFAGLLGAFPLNSSPPRTAIVKESGGASQLTSLVAVATIVVIALAASGLLAFLPQAALAGILVYIATHIFRLRDMIRIAKYSRREFQLLVAGALLVIVLPIQTGMLLAIILSLAHGIQLMMRPPATELVHVEDTTIWWPIGDRPNGTRVPGVVVFSPAAPVNFTNAEYLHDRILEVVAKADAPVKLLVLESSGVTDFDYTGTQTLERTIKELRERGTDVVLARLIVTHAQLAAKRSGLLDTLGPNHVFMSVHEAVHTVS